MKKKANKGKRKRKLTAKRIEEYKINCFETPTNCFFDCVLFLLKPLNKNYVDTEPFVQLVASYKDIIENKKTDSVTGKQKEECWNKICNNFNSDTISNHRSVNSLKGLWDNLKKKTRKHYADLRKDRFATGGGKSEVSEDPMCDRIKGMIDLTVTGLENPFDSEEMIGAGTSYIFEGSPNKENFGDKDQYTIEILDEALDTESTSNGDWAKWNPAMLCHPKSQPLLTEKIVQMTKERKEEEEKENSVASPTYVNVKPLNSKYKRRCLCESQRKTSAFYRNKQLIELAESKKELVNILKVEERSKSNLEIQILKVQLEKERCELEVASKKLRLYDAILNKKLSYSVNLQ